MDFPIKAISAKQAKVISAKPPRAISSIIPSMNMRDEAIAWETKKMFDRIRGAAEQAERSVGLGWVLPAPVVKTLRNHGYTVTEEADSCRVEW